MCRSKGSPTQGKQLKYRCGESFAVFTNNQPGGWEAMGGHKLSMGANKLKFKK